MDLIALQSECSWMKMVIKIIIKIHLFHCVCFISLAPSSGSTIVKFIANSTSLLLEWMPPSEDTRNGIVREYLVMVEEEITGRIWNIRTNEAHAIVRNRHPYYVYISTVYAITTAMGPPSEPIHIVTGEEGNIFIITVMPKWD